MERKKAARIRPPFLILEAVRQKKLNSAAAGARKQIAAEIQEAAAGASAAQKQDDDDDDNDENGGTTRFLGWGWCWLDHEISSSGLCFPSNGLSVLYLNS